MKINNALTAHFPFRNGFNANAYPPHWLPAIFKLTRYCDSLDKVSDDKLTFRRNDHC